MREQWPLRPVPPSRWSGRSPSPSPARSARELGLCARGSGRTSQLQVGQVPPVPNQRSVPMARGAPCEDALGRRTASPGCCGRARPRDPNPQPRPPRRADQETLNGRTLNGRNHSTGHLRRRDRSSSSPTSPETAPPSPRVRAHSACSSPQPAGYRESDRTLIGGARRLLARPNPVASRHPQSIARPALRLNPHTTTPWPMRVPVGRGAVKEIRT